MVSIPREQRREPPDDDIEAALDGAFCPEASAALDRRDNHDTDGDTDGDEISEASE